MPIGMNGTIFEGVSILAQPNSYKATVTPENMQRGMTAVVKGEFVEGTGKCFEYAQYGKLFFDLINDEQGNTVCGISLENYKGVNVIFFSTTKEDDVLSQNKFILREIKDNEAIKIGTNLTTGGNVYAVYIGSDLIIYSTDTDNTETQINYFVGKDNTL